MRFTLLLLTLCGLAWASSAQTLGNFTNLVTAVPTNMPAGSFSNSFAKVAFQPRPGYGVGAEVQLWSANPLDTSFVTFGFDFAYRTTNNWGTATPLKWRVQLNGTNPVLESINFPKEWFESCKAVTVSSVFNESLSAVTITNFCFARPVSQR